jgi:drug/metabolite transporter (DMT)-like permease
MNLRAYLIREGAPCSSRVPSGQNAVAAMLLLPSLLLHPPRISVQDAILLLALGIFSTACAHVLFIQGLATARAQVASIVTGLEPVYGIVLAWLCLRETPPLRTIVGGLLILTATVCTAVTHSETRNDRPNQRKRS